MADFVTYKLEFWSKTTFISQDNTSPLASRVLYLFQVFWPVHHPYCWLLVIMVHVYFVGMNR